MLVDAPLLSTVIKLSAVTTLLDVGDKMSTSPAADPEAVIVRVPIEAPAEFFTVTVESDEEIDPSRTVRTLDTVPANGIGTYTVSTAETSSR